MQETVIEAGIAVAELVREKSPEGTYQVHPLGLEEVVADKGYHGNEVSVGLKEWVCAAMWPSQIVKLVSGMVKKMRKPPCMPTGGAFAASEASGCSANAENGLNETSRTSLIRAV